ALHFVNVMTRPIVAPWGGADARFGTNPCCIGVPLAGQPPMILDFATSAVAQGKMRVAHNKGERVPPGRLIDDQGRPTDDPRYVVTEPWGALLPFGGHKGSGLAIVCELLGGALTGGGTTHGPHDGSRRVYNGMLSVLIDPARTGSGADTFFSESAAFVESLRRSPPAPGFDRVRIAGEPEREARARRMAEGIPVDATTWEEILLAGEKVGVARAATSHAAGLS
ncbi:MAG: Ldh family oxidoreductase, partial [Gammaproteobacteria bacterium]